MLEVVNGDYIKGQDCLPTGCRVLGGRKTPEGGMCSPKSFRCSAMVLVVL